MASFWRQPLTFTVVMEEQPSGRSPEGCSHSMHFGGAQSRYSKLSFMPARHVLHVSAWLMNSSDAFASVLADNLQRCTTRRIWATGGYLRWQTIGPDWPKQREAAETARRSAISPGLWPAVLRVVFFKALG